MSKKNKKITPRINYFLFTDLLLMKLAICLLLLQWLIAWNEKKNICSFHFLLKRSIATFNEGQIIFIPAQKKGPICIMNYFDFIMAWPIWRASCFIFPQLFKYGAHKKNIIFCPFLILFFSFSS